MDALTRALGKCNGSILNKTFNEQVDLEVTLPKHEVVNFLNRFN
jgi:putative IMPACT (imprinted ancient) family translation regulator